ncbi:MAG: hypothetical protein J3K34DRAFT_66228 [Monoraphidium minutum]|nr:MAG: hypothetical protein J3K34DRAFT_66228 [Monoraphidium minutum]
MRAQRSAPACTGGARAARGRTAHRRPTGGALAGRTRLDVRAFKDDVPPAPAPTVAARPSATPLARPLASLAAALTLLPGLDQPRPQDHQQLQRPLAAPDHASDGQTPWSGTPATGSPAGGVSRAEVAALAAVLQRLATEVSRLRRQVKELEGAWPAAVGGAQQQQRVRPGAALQGGGEAGQPEGPQAGHATGAAAGARRVTSHTVLSAAVGGRRGVVSVIVPSFVACSASWRLAACAGGTPACGAPTPHPASPAAAAAAGAACAGVAGAGGQRLPRPVAMGLAAAPRVWPRRPAAVAAFTIPAVAHGRTAESAAAPGTRGAPAAFTTAALPALAAATHVVMGGALHRLLFEAGGTAVVLAPGRVEVTAAALAAGAWPLRLPSSPAGQIAALSRRCAAASAGAPHLGVEVCTDGARAALRAAARRAGDAAAAAERGESPAEVRLPCGRAARKHVMMGGALRPVYESALEQFVAVEAPAPGGAVGARVQWLSRVMDVAFEEVFLLCA